MELRPRKGRSVQPPSTPTVAKPSPRPPAQSSSRKKPASTPIHVLSDDADEGPEATCPDSVDAAPKEIPADKVTTSSREKRHKSDLKQGNRGINLSDTSEFETPVSSNARVRRAQIKVGSSKNSKSKSKAASSIKKKMAEELGSTPVADTHIAINRIATTSGKVRPDKAMTKKVSGIPNGVVASEESEKQEAFTDSARQNSDELAVEINLLAQEVCLEKTEVLSPSFDGKQVHSSIMKSVKKTDENNEVVDAKVDWSGHPEHIVDVFVPAVNEAQALSLILSDDETVQESDAVQADGCEEKISASEEAAIEKCLPGAGISKTSRTRKKSQSHKKLIMEEESLGRKLFGETCDDNQDRHELGSIATSSKEGVSQIDSAEAKNSAERVVNTNERHSFKSPSVSLKGREVPDIEMLDVHRDKLNASDTGNEGEDIANDDVQEVSEESSDEAASSGDERDGDINSDHAKLDAAIACSQKKAVHHEECSSSNDDDGTASSDSDDGDDEDEMASIFFSSLKAHFHKKAESSGLGMQKDEEAKPDALTRLESQLTKAVVKKPCANGGLTGHGLLWSPEIMLSASKTSKAQLGKSRSIVEASPDTIWAKERCLQDGLCVPPVDPLKLNKLARKQQGDTAGAKWFNLSAPTITPEMKKELQLVKLRGALDPKRHYKADDSKGLPKYFQVGTVIGGPADFYSGRLTKKEQKSSLASELLSDSSLTAYRKRKFLEIQDQKQAGGKGFWKKKKSKRTPAWAKI